MKRTLYLYYISGTRTLTIPPILAANVRQQTVPDITKKIKLLKLSFSSLIRRFKV